MVNSAFSYLLPDPKAFENQSCTEMSTSPLSDEDESKYFEHINLTDSPQKKGLKEFFKIETIRSDKPVFEAYNNDEILYGSFDKECDFLDRINLTHTIFKRYIQTKLANIPTVEILNIETVYDDGYFIFEKPKTISISNIVNTLNECLAIEKLKEIKSIFEKAVAFNTTVNISAFSILQNASNKIVTFDFVNEPNHSLLSHIETQVSSFGPYAEIVNPKICNIQGDINISPDEIYDLFTFIDISKHSILKNVVSDAFVNLTSSITNKKVIKAFEDFQKDVLNFSAHNSSLQKLCKGFDTTTSILCALKFAIEQRNNSKKSESSEKSTQQSFQPIQVKNSITLHPYSFKPFQKTKIRD